VLLPACENDLKKVREISAKEFTNPVDSSMGVEVIYSDSARVKAHLQTPLLLDFGNSKTPHKEMPKGITLTFYDKDLKPSGTVVSDYAITSNNDKIIALTKNVVLRSTAGDTFKSEEMIWDQTKKLLYTNQRWEWHKADGTDLTGSRFETNETFTKWNNVGANGIIEMRDGIKP
jgi:LPS export ABC transporter protein LptC